MANRSMHTHYAAVAAVFKYTMTLNVGECDKVSIIGLKNNFSGT